MFRIENGKKRESVKLSPVVKELLLRREVEWDELQEIQREDK